MPNIKIERALVSILEPSTRQPIGCGFLVASGKHIVTCAHVVADVLNISQDDVIPLTKEVYLNFPLLPNPRPMRARVCRWFPVKQYFNINDITDVAVLEVMDNDLLPTDAMPMPITEWETFDEKVCMFGFPNKVKQGKWLTGKIMGPASNGRIQINSDESPVIGGFSGTPVWSKERKSIVGIIVSAYTDTNNAYMIPISTFEKIEGFKDIFGKIKKKTTKSKLNIPIDYLPIEEYFKQIWLILSRYFSFYKNGYLWFMVTFIIMIMPITVIIPVSNTFKDVLLQEIPLFSIAIIISIITDNYLFLKNTNNFELKDFSKQFKQLVVEITPFILLVLYLMLYVIGKRSKEDGVGFIIVSEIILFVFAASYTAFIKQIAWDKNKWML